MRGVLPVLAAVALGACSNGGAPAAPAPSLSGTYAGSFANATVASNPLAITLVQNGGSLSGSWSGGLVDPTGEFPYSNGGDLTGSVVGTAVTMHFFPNVYDESGYALTGTFNGSTITGTFTTINTNITGTFTATKD